VLRLSSLLGGWAPKEGAAPPGSDPVRLLAAVWPEIVGADVAQHSRPTQLSGDALLVTTRSGAWSEQLSYLSERILAAVRARLPRSGIARLRFRVGVLHEGSIRERRGRVVQSVRPPPRVRDAPASAAEALARFRSDVEDVRRAKASCGWKECPRCSALIAPGASCVPCALALAEQRERKLSRLLFEAPWLGYAGVAAILGEIDPKEYETIRRRLLARWWERLSRAARSRTLSRDGSERSVASSYVILQSGLPPERIGTAALRNVLGDELHELLYGTEENNNTNVE
jgi:hypothetical protein